MTTRTPGRADTEALTELEILVPEQLFRRFHQAAACQGHSPEGLLISFIRSYVGRQVSANKEERRRHR